MTNSELISKLNSLKSVRPDKEWLESNRELLLSQVSNSGAEELTGWRLVVINFSSALKSVAQPVYALGAFVLMLLAGSLFSGRLLAGTKPNDSLYIARILSEKVKVNTTFGSEARNKMEMKFASEHAQDISAILADPSFNNEANQDQVAKLNESFNEEVSVVKEGLSRLVAPIAPVAKNDDVVIADSSKDQQGIQMSEQPAEAVASIASASALTVMPEVATSTVEAETEASSTVETVEAAKIIDEAQQLFNSKDYGKASDKLKEVNEIIR